MFSTPENLLVGISRALGMPQYTPDTPTPLMPPETPKWPLLLVSWGEWPTWLKPGKWHKWAVQLFLNMWHYLQWLFTNMYIHNLILHQIYKNAMRTISTPDQFTHILPSTISCITIPMYYFHSFIHFCNALPISAISLKIWTPKLQLLHNTEQRSLDMERWLTPLENFYIWKTFYLGG